MDPKIKEALRELNIKLYSGNRVDSQQAAKIMTWRIKSEQGTEHQYTDRHVRRHVATGTLKKSGEIHNRLNLFKVEDIFALKLMPTRGHQGRKQEEQRPSEQIREVA